MEPTDPRVGTDSGAQVQGEEGDKREKRKEGKRKGIEGIEEGHDGELKLTR